MFIQIDEDNSGQIDREELLVGMTMLYGKERAKQEVQRIFEIADTDGSGKIDFTEFKSAFVQKELMLQDDKLKEMFNKYDEDGSGTISLDEFKVAFIGKSISDK